MRYPLLILCALCASSCLATSGEIDRAIADITGEFAIIANDSRQSAQEARDAWARGEINAAELEAELANIRKATMDVAAKIPEDVLDGVKEAIKERPAEVAEAVGGLLPGPWGEILATIGIGATAIYAKIEAQKRAKEEAERVNRERDVARIARHEPTGGQVATK